MASGRQRLMKGLGLAVVGLSIAGCGSDYVVLHPAGPVAQSELHLIVLSTVIVGVVILLVWVLWAYVLLRFRDIPGNQAPYLPNWRHHRVLEILVFALPVVALIAIGIPTVRKTYALDHVPSHHPLVIDVTSLDYKWVFEYPRQHIATVNYFYMPVGRPVLFQLTANSPLTAFWVPNLGGMEYAMPNRVLPLWLEATRHGVFLGRNSNFNGIDFWRMTFEAHAVSELDFHAWVHRIQVTKPPMTHRDWRRLLHRSVTAPAAFSGYPANTFPERATQFTVKGLHYIPTREP